MRILIVNCSNRKVAGAEDYLVGIIPALNRKAHAIAFAYEADAPQTRACIPLPPGVPSWNLSALGINQTLHSMKAWRPDLIYAHGTLNTRFESRFLEIAPAVYFAHNYHGTCISGLKTFKFPTIQPCDRRFGATCLLHYLPKRCGGRNPITMWKLFRSESRRRRNLLRYRAIVTHSTHMRAEYIRNGFSPSRVYGFTQAVQRQVRTETGEKADGTTHKSINKDRWNLLYVGRMEPLKGGSTLLDAIPIVVGRLSRSIHLVLAGDGPAKSEWERKSKRLQSENSSLSFEFTGWVDDGQLSQIYANTNLLVIPSLWPEPFGRVGLEASLRGIPVAAFNVGGVSDWLINGVNGFLAAGNPPTSSRLADAIVKCLENRETYHTLSAGGPKVADRFSLARHLETLDEVFHQVVCGIEIRPSILEPAI